MYLKRCAFLVGILFIALPLVFFFMAVEPYFFLVKEIFSGCCSSVEDLLVSVFSALSLVPEIMLGLFLSGGIIPLMASAVMFALGICAVEAAVGE